MQTSDPCGGITAAEFQLQQLQAALRTGTRQLVFFTESGQPPFAGDGAVSVFSVCCKPFSLRWLQTLQSAGYRSGERTFFDLTALCMHLPTAGVQVILRELFAAAPSGSEALLWYGGSGSADSTAEDFLERDVPQRMAARANARIYVRQQAAGGGEFLLLGKK